jgi:rod shape-determining protein MreC
LFSIKWIKKVWIWASLILILIFLISSNHQKNEDWNPIEKFVVEITAPFQTFYSSCVSRTKNLWLKYFDLINTHKQNLRLKTELNSLKADNYRYRELLASYQRLQKVLSFAETSENPVTAAKVIGRDPSGLFKSLIINKGKSSGLSVNMPVVNADGVVGRLISVSDNFSKVLLLIDQNSAVDCIIERSRDKGIVKGLSSKEISWGSYMDYALKTSDIIVGDLVATSGLDGIFPKGIPVGEVTDIKDNPDAIFMEINIKPSVDFTKLEEVLVILKEDILAKYLTE